MKYYIKIKGKYFVQDSKPTSTSKKKACDYSMKAGADSDAAILKKQLNLTDKQIKVVFE